MSPVYKQLGLSVGYVVHESTPPSASTTTAAAWCTSPAKSSSPTTCATRSCSATCAASTQTTSACLMTPARRAAASNSRPVSRAGRRGRQPADRRSGHAADHQQLAPTRKATPPCTTPPTTLALHDAAEGRDFTVDTRSASSVDLTARGQQRLEGVCPTKPASGKAQRRREELVTQALTGMYCFIRDEQYLVDARGQGPDHRRVHRPRHGRPVLAARPAPGDRNQGERHRHGRQGEPGPAQLPAVLPPVPHHGRHDRHRLGSGPELWQIYQRPIVRIPTNRPCIRVQLPTVMFETAARSSTPPSGPRVRAERQGRPRPGRHAQRCCRSEEVSRRLTAAGRPHKRAERRPDRGRSDHRLRGRPVQGRITVATNMAGRGTDIKLSQVGVAALGGLHVVATEPGHQLPRRPPAVRPRRPPGRPRLRADVRQRRRRAAGPPRPAGPQACGARWAPTGSSARPRPVPSGWPASTAARCSAATTGWTNHQAGRAVFSRGG